MTHRWVKKVMYFFTFHFCLFHLIQILFYKLHFQIFLPALLHAYLIYSLLSTSSVTSVVVYLPPKSGVTMPAARVASTAA